MNLRKYAAGKPCMLRLEGICNFNPETTVLAHVRRAGNAGVGQKPPDICGIWACFDCHNAIDKRNNVGSITPSEMDGYILDGLIRTLAQLDRDGVL